MRKAVATVATKKVRPVEEKRGGYTSGAKPVSQLKPPPKGPGIGARPNGNSQVKPR
jgi:hypothetical protein